MRHSRLAIALLALGLLPVPAPAQSAPTDGWLDQTRTRWVAVAQKIWETPELALEKKSSAALAAELEKEGFRVTWGSGGEATAFVATAGEGSPVVALLAEYDALPGLSQAAGKPKKEALAENGPGHGCGHNLLGTAAVAAAIAANRARVEQKLSGTIQLFGTPAEAPDSLSTLVSPLPCHPEERSDEGSAPKCSGHESRSFASLRMTEWSCSPTVDSGR